MWWAVSHFGSSSLYSNMGKSTIQANSKAWRTLGASRDFAEAEVLAEPRAHRAEGGAGDLALRVGDHEDEVAGLGAEEGDELLRDAVAGAGRALQEELRGAALELRPRR